MDGQRRREEKKGTRKETEQPRGMRIETVVILVATAFIVGFILGGVVALLRTSPARQTDRMVSQGQKEVSPIRPLDYSQEIRTLEDVAENDPGNPDAWIHLGDVYYRSRQFDRAVEAYANALNLQPARAEVLVKLGNAHFDRGAYEEAIETYSSALSMDPENADVLTDLGIAYRRTGSPGEASKAFKRAAQMDARHVNSRYNLGVVLFHDLNDKEGAIRAWEEFLEIEPPGERADQVRRMLETLKTM